MHLWGGELSREDESKPERNKCMRRWDSLVEGYMGVCEARGLSAESQRGIRDEVDRFGCWLKRRRPKPNLEEVDGQILIEYLRKRTRFHAKSTVVSVASKLR